ncbi:MAG: hypothetical protein K6A82_06495 [Prevotella sp.]|nr:hypothetical protein [Prevotella sp.]
MKLRLLFLTILCALLFGCKDDEDKEIPVTKDTFAQTVWEGTAEYTSSRGTKKGVDIYREPVLVEFYSSSKGIVVAENTDTEAVETEFTYSIDGKILTIKFYTATQSEKFLVTKYTKKELQMASYGEVTAIYYLHRKH